MDAIRKHTKLKLQVIAAGAHFLPPAKTIREVEAAYPVAARVPMQRAGKTGRAADAEALGRGVSGFAKAFTKLKPDWVVVLGDRIEAFAAASAASIAGIAVCHIHGGDRAEGIADEAMRHAITKLAHLHCAATKLSAERIRKMGEKPEFVHVTGSPAIDGIDRIREMTPERARAFGDPIAVVLLHPSGGTSVDEAESTGKCFGLMYALDRVELTNAGGPLQHNRILLLDPNGDPGRENILEWWSRKVGCHRRSHLPRHEFVSLLKRVARNGGALFGNSSAGLIEAAAIGLPVANVGPRQNGRERGGNVVDAPLGGDMSLPFKRLRTLVRRGVSASRLFGDGRAGPRIAALLAQTDPHSPALLRKHNSY